VLSSSERSQYRFRGEKKAFNLGKQYRRVQSYEPNIKVKDKCVRYNVICLMSQFNVTPSGWKVIRSQPDYVHETANITKLTH